MPTLQDLQILDCLGFGKIIDRQIKPLVATLKRTGMLNEEVPNCAGKGVVVAGGGKYLSWAWVNVAWLRKLGCTLPIQVWYMGASEMPAWAKSEFAKMNAETVDALALLKAKPHRMLGTYANQRKWTMAGWVLKNYAIANCPYRQVLFLDADCFPAANPETLMSRPEIEGTGGLFFHDVANHAMSPWAWVYCELTLPTREWEAGQYIVNKDKGWMGLRWANWMNEHADTFFSLVHGDKTTTELGFRVSGVPLIVSGENQWKGWGIEHSYEGAPVFWHAMGFKRNETGAPNTEIEQLFWEYERLRAQRPA